MGPLFFLIIWYLFIHAHQIFCNVYFECGGFIYLFAESLLLQKRVKLPLRNRCLVSISRTRAVAPTLFAQTGIPNGKPNNVKVFRLLKLKVGTCRFGSAYSWYGNSILIPWVFCFAGFVQSSKRNSCGGGQVWYLQLLIRWIVWCKVIFFNAQQLLFWFCCLSVVTVASISSRCIDEIYDALAERLLPTAAVASNPKLKWVLVSRIRKENCEIWCFLVECC